MRQDEYLLHDALSLTDLARRREVSPSEIVEAAFARIDHVNGRINAVIHLFAERARASAGGNLPNGPFKGLPFLIKDLAGALEGAPLTKGSNALRHYIASHDSEMVARYRRAGVVFIGSTNAPELGLGATTEPELHGPTRNPWNLSCTAGGSSGGAAAAVAAGIVPVAQGGDGGGSLRIPASVCGLFGLKPTRGRMPLGPDNSDSWNGFVVPHVISRSVRDSAAFLDATHGADTGAPYVAPPPERPFLQEIFRPPGRLRVAVIKHSIFGIRTHPDCLAACEDAAGLLSSLGHIVEEASLPISAEEARWAFLVVVAACTAAEVDSIGKLLGRRPNADMFEPATWFLRQAGRALSAADLEQARITVGSLSRAVGGFFEKVDVALSPTLPYPPGRIGESGLKHKERISLATLRRAGTRSMLKWALAEFAAQRFEKSGNTMLFNMTGQPAMSVPLYWNAGGLPIGTQLVGRFGDEATLLRLASQLEKERPWARRRPAL